MRFKTHVQDWEEMAADDPLWAILTGRRDWTLEEFLATGESDVCHLLAAAERLGFPCERKRALDFGCGVGRVTGPLSKHFQECWGVDLSDEMLRWAKRHNRCCHFRLSQRADLRDFPESHFDLVYSLIVLQHQPDRQTIEQYLREFVRVLRPGGLLAFHLPSRIPLRYRLAPRRRAYRLLHGVGVSRERLHHLMLSPMRMTALSQARVESILKSTGGHFLAAEAHPGSGPIPSLMYYCTKHCD